MEIFREFIRQIVILFLEVSPYLLLGMIIAGLIHLFIGREFISNQIGKGGVSSVVKATLLGIPLPVCSCGVIPIVSSLEKEGAHRSSLMSFLVSTPTTGVDSILATYSLMGPLFALFRPLAAAVAGVSLGLLDFFFEGEYKEKPKPAPHAHSLLHPLFKLREFFRYSFLEVPQDIGRALLIGIVIGAAITAFLPQEWFSGLRPPYDFIASLFLSIPLYVCSTGSIPVAVSLIEKGFSPGAGLIFLIAGPATNAVTLAFVYSKMGKRSFYLYLFNLIIVSLLMGILFNYLWLSFGADQRLLTGAGKMLPLAVKTVSAAVLLLLVLNGLRRKMVCPVNISADLRIAVPDIHCQHCRSVLESKLGELSGLRSVFVDVNKKSVNINGRIDREQALRLIREAGYHPRE